MKLAIPIRRPFTRAPIKPVQRHADRRKAPPRHRLREEQ